MISTETNTFLKNKKMINIFNYIFELSKVHFQNKIKSECIVRLNIYLKLMFIILLFPKNVFGVIELAWVHTVSILGLSL